MSMLSRVAKQEPRIAPDYVRFNQLRQSLKQDLIAAIGLGRVASIVNSANSADVRRELEVTLRAQLNLNEYPSLSESDKERLIQEVLDEVVGLGPLQPLLDDDEVTEVMVNGVSSLFYEKGGHLYQAQRVFESQEQIRMVVDRILAPLGRRLDEASPVVSARLANGDRINAVINPIAIDGPVLTIRKFSNRIVSLATLVELGSVPGWYAQLLSWAVRLRKSIAVAGGTGSGKTTLLNALSCEISHAERIVTIEDSAELRFDTHPHVVRLETRDASIEGTGEITVRDLVKNALRMRPDRIVVGEVRGEETLDMLQAMNTGHAGSLTTLHAGSAEEAISRLVLMTRFGMDLPSDVIKGQIATALDFIVMSKRLPSGERFITSLHQVVPHGASDVSLVRLISFDEAQKTWALECEPDFIAQSLKDGSLSLEEVQTWRTSGLQ